MSETSNLDQQLADSVLENWNLTVPWFLMTSYLYYHRDISIISDETYDNLCTHILKNWSKIKHRHKKLLSRKDLKSGSGFALKERDFPTIVKSAAMLLYEEHKKPKRTRTHLPKRVRARLYSKRRERVRLSDLRKR